MIWKAIEAFKTYFGKLAAEKFFPLDDRESAAQPSFCELGHPTLTGSLAWKAEVDHNFVTSSLSVTEASVRVV